MSPVIAAPPRTSGPRTTSEATQTSGTSTAARRTGNGPCGGATEPNVYFKAHIEGMALIYDSEAYLTDSTKAIVIEPSPIANNKYISSEASAKAGDTEYAYLAAGAWYGENPEESGGFLGMASYILKKGTVKTKTNNVLVASRPGDPEVESYDVCISDLDGEECGEERTFNEGEYKFSVYGYTFGSNFQMEPEVTHLGIRTKLSFVGAKAELRINSDFLTLDEIGSDDVRSIVVSDVAEGGRSVRMEFPAKYNVGVAPEGLLLCFF